MPSDNPIVPFESVPESDPEGAVENIALGLGLCALIRTSPDPRPQTTRLVSSGKSCTKCGNGLNLTQSLTLRSVHIRQEIFYLCPRCQVYVNPESATRFRQTW